VERLAHVKVQGAIEMATVAEAVAAAVPAAQQNSAEAAAIVGVEAKAAAHIDSSQSGR
jgi:hypothetical protein